MDDLIKLIEKLGSKEETAKKLDITVRHIQMILAGDRKPSKQLAKLIKIYLV